MMRRERNNSIAVSIGLIGYVVLGIVPILSVFYKTIDLEIPSLPLLQYNYNTIILFATAFISVYLLLVLYCVMRRYTRYIREIKSLLYFTTDTLKKRIMTLNSFSEPYATIIKEDLKLEIRNLFKGLRTEFMTEGIVSKKGNYSKNNKQELIYKEIILLKEKLSSSILKQPFTFEELISNIKHSITTPLSQIQTNCELLKSSKEEPNKEAIIERIEDATKICLSIIYSYAEASNIISVPSFLEINEMLRSYFKMLIIESNSNVSLELDNVPSTFDGYSSNYVYALLVPLLQNAVAASPKNGIVKVNSEKFQGEYRISVTNECEQTPPNENQLCTSGFSSKPNHIGIGLMTVRNLLDMGKTGELSFQILKRQVTAIIELKARKHE